MNFFHRSGKVVFLSAVREATQSSTHYQQLFSTFRFFSSTRRVVVVARCEPSQNHSRCQQLFCGLRKKSFAGPFRPPVVHGARCAIVKARSVRPLRRPSGAKSVYGPFRDKGQDIFCVKDKKTPPCRRQGGLLTFLPAFYRALTTRVAPTRRLRSSTSFQRLRSSTLTLYWRAIFQRLSLALTT